MDIRQRCKVASSTILAAVRWVFRMLGRGLRAYGRLLWKTTKLAVIVGLALATFGLISQLSIGNVIGDGRRL